MPLPPSVDKDGRQDVLLLKQQLAEALGDNGPSYWQALTDFVSGKLNRQEFDFYANLYLSRNNAPLHNQFILANIHNAQRDAPPPSARSEGWAKGKKGKDGKLLKEKDPKRRKIKNQVMSLGKAERERIKGLKDLNKNSGVVKQKLKEHRISKPLAPPIAQQPLQTEYNRGAHAPLCFDSKELPDFESMRDRMTAVAMENGLMAGVQDTAVELMLHALESHIKSIISNCIIKLRSNRTLGISVPRRDLIQAAVGGTGGAGAAGAQHNGFFGGGESSSGGASSSHLMQLDPPPGLSSSSYQASYANSGHNSKRTTTITAKDLAFAIGISPSMLVENPVNVEKLLSILMEEESEEEDEDADMSDDQDEVSDSMIEL
ncbi:hypothetical protein BGZ47_007327 [Haplosporangium gracile]|nr:hypothetical protein BGZ47_007327 [Haplosporangium gracile]